MWEIADDLHSPCAATQLQGLASFPAFDLISFVATVQSVNNPSLSMAPWVNKISRSALFLENMAGAQVCCTCFRPLSFVSDPMIFTRKPIPEPKLWGGILLVLACTEYSHCAPVVLICPISSDSHRQHHCLLAGTIDFSSWVLELVFRLKRLLKLVLLGSGHGSGRTLHGRSVPSLNTK